MKANFKVFFGTNLKGQLLLQVFGGDNSDTEDECKKGSNRSAGNKKSEQGKSSKKS